MSKKRRHILLHVLIWVTLISIVVTHAFYDDDDSPLLFLIRMLIGTAIFYVNYLILVPKILFKKRILFYILSVILLVFVSAKGLIMIEELDQFAMYTDNFSEEGQDEKEVGFMVYTLLIFIGAVIRTYGEWNRNEQDKREIENQKNLSELEVLKNQINPHFLFNSLNSICSLAVKKSDEAPDAIIMLSELMRYMLYEVKGERVLLSKEIAYIENYVSLQKLRLANKDQVSLRIVGDIQSQRISPLILISFIENAFKYGIDTTEETSISITIDAYENDVTFNCVNRINKRKKKQDDNSGIGIQNTKERLKLLYPEKHQLSIQEENNMFIVNLFLKLN
ncbi:sensor histidine kinase [Pseudotenacibaculum haliotis]|uniref:Sensor histidine kinase n=1 Tax=Pseudotenacibaculum haliotis TaxID=1862138 RepID=A0ABW5LTS1_9FLAO